jgi:hypothetical protein
MVDKYNYLLIIVIILLFLALAFCQDPVAVVLKDKGEVTLLRKDETKPREVKKGTVLFDGDKISTKEVSFCAIKFIDDGSLLRVKEKSTCVIEGKREEEHINKNIIIEIGTFFTSLFKPRGTFTVTTPTSVASVKGTQWWTLQLSDGRTLYIGLEGLIDLSNSAGKVLLRAGQTAVYTSASELPEIRLTQSGEIPTLEEDLEGIKSLEIEFMDADGQTKRMRIDYQEQ